MENQSQFYVIKIPQTQLKKLKNEPKFILIMQLCRYLNQLSFCLGVYVDNIGNETPKGIRQRHNAIFFAASVLYEAFKVVGALGKEFKNYKSFKAGFSTFLKDPNVVFLKDNLLNKFRSGVVFHVLDSPIRETLQTLNLSKYHFAVSTSEKFSETYYQLADDIALNYFIGDNHASPQAEATFYFEANMKIINVMNKYIKFANSLIGEYAQLKYWKVETRETL